MDSKRSSKGNASLVFYIFIACLWLLVALTVGFLKYNEKKIIRTDWNNSIGVVNDVIAVLVDNDTSNIDANFNDIYKSLYRSTNYEDIFITVRDREGRIITTNDLNDSKGDIDSDSLFCLKVIKGEAPKSGIRTELGQQRAYRVSDYPDLGLVVASEVVFSNEYASNIKNDFNGFILVISILGFIITIYFIIYMLRFRSSVDRLYRVLDYIHRNENPEPLLDYRWNKNVDVLAQSVVSIYADKIKIIEEHYAEKERTIEEEQSDMHAKRILTNNLRHELKTPIGIISGYIETILEHPDLPTELQQKFLGSCLRNVRRINNLVTSLSLLSRLEDGADAILYEDINLKDVITDIQDEFTPKLREAKMEFEIDVPDDIHVLSSNSSLYALFNNLIKNAINYSNGTKMGLRFIEEKNEFYKFVFWDNGEGVEQEFIDHLFERFFRIEKNKTRVTDGTGLGLPIVKLVIDNHGGKITVANRPEGGLEYTFTLPKVVKKN